jgi:hypothetical protein
MSKSDQLYNKKSIWVYRTTSRCSLDHYELLCYSYMAYQARFGKTPSLRAIHHSTGMSKDTAQTVCHRLQRHGLLDSDGVIIDISKNERLGWFAISEDLRARNEHFSGWITNWRCYIRQPGVKLTLDCISVYSFVRHCAITKFRPHQGMTPAYIASVLGISPKTTSDALVKLKDADLVAVDGKNLKVFRLTDPQLTLFMDKAEGFDSANRGGDCEFVDQLPPGLSARIAERVEIIRVLMKALKYERADQEEVDLLVVWVRMLTDWRSQLPKLVNAIPTGVPLKEQRKQFESLLRSEVK